MHKWLINKGFVPRTAYPCLYVRTDGLIFVVLYVDDILIIGEDVVAIEDTKLMVMGHFSMTDLGSR